MEGKILLQINKVNKIFNEGTPDEKMALSNIQLHLNKGDFVTIIGSNGAGKSTLMNIVSGKIIADTGNVKIAGIDTTTMAEHKRAHYIGRVFQDPMAGTAPNMTIEENLAIAYNRTKTRTLRLGTSKKRREFLREQLATLHLGLENRLQAKVGLLSGGERQALSLLMATFTEPKILLLDEHTAALDPKTSKQLMHLTEQRIEEGNLTCLMITHRMEDALRYGNRLIVLQKGKIVQDLNAAEKAQLTLQDLLLFFEEVE